MAEGHAKFADGPIEINTKLISQFQNLALPDVDHHNRLARMLSKNPLQTLNVQLVQRR